MITIYNTFVGTNLIAGLGWALLLFSPRLPDWTRLLAGIIMPIILSATYLVLFVLAWPFAGGGFDNPENLSQLFSQPQLAVTGWVHYLAFDLFIGGWQVRVANAEQLPGHAVTPCLLLTMVCGPIGLLVFFAVRYFYTEKRTAATEQNSVQSMQRAVR